MLPSSKVRSIVSEIADIEWNNYLYGYFDYSSRVQ